MNTSLIERMTTAIYDADQHQGYGAITDDCARRFAEVALYFMQQDLAEKLNIILRSQEQMMESFLFQQKMIGSLLASGKDD